MSERILLVDDESQLLRAIMPALLAENYEVTTARSGRQALELLAGEGCDVMVLDLGLPDMDGKAVIAEMRVWSDAPVVVLSARNLTEEKIAALDLGADDFVNKPFEIGELLARIRAVLRGRLRRRLSQTQLKRRGLEVDFARRRVLLEGFEVKLSPREYDLLKTLARHPDAPVTHRQIITAVWGSDGAVEPQVLRVLVGQLRQKIEADTSRPRLILTEAGVGYRLAPADAGDADS